MILRSPAPDPEGMRARLDAAEQNWLDGERGLVEQRFEAYVLRAGSCHACGGDPWEVPTAFSVLVCGDES